MFGSNLYQSVFLKSQASLKLFKSFNQIDKVLFSTKLFKTVCSPHVLADKKHFAPNYIVSGDCKLFSSKTEKPIDFSASEHDSSNELSFLDSIDYDSITGKDPELVKQLKIIVAEIYVMYEEGKEIPTKLSTNDFKDILRLKSRSSRMQHLRFLFINEKKRESDKTKKLAKRELREIYLKEKSEKKALEPPGIMEYGLTSNTIFLRIYDSSMDRYNNFRLFQSQMFGPKIVIDCGYDKNMSKKDSNLCAKQLMQGFGENRLLNFPLHLVFCNYDKNCNTSQKLFKYIPTMYDDTFPFEYHSESYLDLYPKEKLVYLTPHCKEELYEVNNEDIYIIGAIVDRSFTEPLSLGKAKKEGIRMAKFPIDKYLEWGSGKKNLTLNQCIMIMADVMWKKDWKYAFDKWIPKRKLMSADHVSYAAKMLRRIERNNPPPIYNYNNQQRFRNNNYYRKNNFGSNNAFDEDARTNNTSKEYEGGLPPRRKNHL